MITAEAIAAFPVGYHDRVKWPIRVGDWLCGPAWAYRGGDEFLALAKETKDTNRATLDGFEGQMPGEPTTENAALRIPFVVGVEDITKTCSNCGGDGGHDCDCDFCEVGCKTCDGAGEIVVTAGRREEPGQRVYIGGGVTSIANERLGTLFDGLRVVRLGATNISPLGGVDGSGRLVAIVMPIRGDVRQPVAEHETGALEGVRL